MNVTQGLHRAFQQMPDGIATICAGRTRTHRESVDRIARLAGALQGLGVRDGERAAILSLNSDRYHEFLAAAVWAGGVFVPVNLRWSIAEIAESLAEVDARVLLVDDAFTGHVDGIRAAHPDLQHVVHSGDGPTPSGCSPSRSWSRAPSPSRTPAAATTWPPSSTPAAPPAGPRAPCSATPTC